MKSAEEILAEIDRTMKNHAFHASEIATHEQVRAGHQAALFTLQGIRSFILEPSKRCEHAWRKTNRYTDVETFKCYKCDTEKLDVSVTRNVFEDLK